MGLVRKAVKDTDGATSALQLRMSSLSSTAERTAGALGRIASIVGSLAAVRGVYKSFTDFETGLVAVAKTTNLADKVVHDFGEQIRTLSTYTPVASRDMLEIAAAAAQLGVRGSSDLLKFSDTVAKLSVATNISGESAVISLAKLLAATGEAPGQVVKLGNVIDALGNNSRATESVILHVSQQVALATTRFKVSSQDVTALGATLAGLGVRAELSGFVIGRAFRSIDNSLRYGGERAALLAEVIGKPIDVIQEKWSKNTFDVFLDFEQGLKRAQDAGSDLTTILERLGLTGEENLKVLPTLAVRYSELAKSVGVARQEAVQQIALNREADRAFGKVTSEVQVLKNAMMNLGLEIGREVEPQFRNALEQITSFVLVLSRSPQAVHALTVSLEAVIGLLTALTAVRVTQFFGGAIQVIWGLTKSLYLLLPAIAVVGAAFASLEFGRYLYEESESIQESMAEIIFWVERMSGHVVEIFTNLKTEIHSILEDIGKMVDVPITSNTFWHNLRDNVLTAIGSGLAPGGPGRNELEQRGLWPTAGANLDPISETDPSFIGPPFDLYAKHNAARESRFESDRIAAERFKVTLASIRHEFDGLRGTPGERVKGSTFSDFLGGDIQPLLTKIDELRTKFTTLPPEIVAAQEALRALIADPTSGEDKTATDAVNELGESIDILPRAVEAARDRITELFRDVQGGLELSGFTGDQRRIEEAVVRLRELQQGKAGQDGPQLGVVQEQAQEQAIRRLVEMQIEQERVAQMWENIGAAGAQAFEDIIYQADSLNDVLKGLFTEISKQAFRTFAGIPLANFIAGLGSSLYGSSGSFFGGPGAARGGIMSGGSLHTFAMGGTAEVSSTPRYFPMANGNTAVYGEAGPELGFLPLKRGNDGRLGLGSPEGGARPNIVVNVQSPNPAGFMASTDQIAAAMYRATQKASRAS